MTAILLYCVVVASTAATNKDIYDAGAINDIQDQADYDYVDQELLMQIDVCTRKTLGDDYPDVEYFTSFSGVAHFFSAFGDDYNWENS